MKQQIFISYSRKDIEFANRLAAALENAGHTIWIDSRGMAPGSSWPEQLVKAIEASDMMVLILSPASSMSPEVNSEVHLARHKFKKRILPVMYKQTPLSTRLQYNLSDTHYLDFTVGSFADNIAKLIAAIENPDAEAVAENPDATPNDEIAASEVKYILHELTATIWHLTAKKVIRSLRPSQDGLAGHLWLVFVKLLLAPSPRSAFLFSFAITGAMPTLMLIAYPFQETVMPHFAEVMIFLYLMAVVTSLFSANISLKWHKKFRDRKVAQYLERMERMAAQERYRHPESPASADFHPSIGFPYRDWGQIRTTITKLTANPHLDIEDVAQYFDSSPSGIDPQVHEQTHKVFSVIYGTVMATYFGHLIEAAISG